MNTFLIHQICIDKTFTTIGNVVTVNQNIQPLVLKVNANNSTEALEKFFKETEQYKFDEKLIPVCLDINLIKSI